MDICQIQILTLNYFEMFAQNIINKIRAIF